MRVGLLGKHPDGLEMASALVETGRHQLVAYSEAVDPFWADRWPGARLVADAEEILADPAVEAVIVAGSPTRRADQLRRALQSERHVLCVHPPDRSTDIGYEAALLQKDAGFLLFPLLPEDLHPALRRFRQVLGGSLPGQGERPSGPQQLIHLEWCGEGELLPDIAREGVRPSFPVWSMLRAAGGEIAEVGGMARGETAEPGEPILLTGAFEGGGLFQVALLPGQKEESLRWTGTGPGGRAELFFPSGWPTPAYLSWQDAQGLRQEEAWTGWDPWAALLEAFERRLEAWEQARSGGGAAPADVGDLPGPTWDDCIRALELDDAARRGIERRRVLTMEYPEATEEAGFKGAMVLVGCAALWGTLFLLVLSNWLPWLRWIIGPMLVVFLILQLLRYLIPAR